MPEGAASSTGPAPRPAGRPGRSRSSKGLGGRQGVGGGHALGGGQGSAVEWSRGPTVLRTSGVAQPGFGGARPRATDWYLMRKTEDRGLLHDRRDRHSRCGGARRLCAGGAGDRGRAAQRTLGRPGCLARQRRRLVGGWRALRRRRRAPRRPQGRSASRKGAPRWRTPWERAPRERAPWRRPSLVRRRPRGRALVLRPSAAGVRPPHARPGGGGRPDAPAWGRRRAGAVGGVQANEGGWETALALGARRRGAPCPRKGPRGARRHPGRAGCPTVSAPGPRRAVRRGLFGTHGRYRKTGQTLGFRTFGRSKRCKSVSGWVKKADGAVHFMIRYNRIPRGHEPTSRFPPQVRVGPFFFPAC